MSHYITCHNCGEPECMDSDTGVHRRDDGTVCPDPRDAEVEGLRAELAAADRSVDRLSACVSNGDGNIRRLEREAEGLRAEVERLTAENAELRTVEWAGTRIACASCRSLFKPPAQVGMSVPERECASCRRAEAAEAEVARLRAAALPEDAEERIARTCFEWDRGATWDERTNSDVENYTDQARAVLAALRGDA